MRRKTVLKHNQSFMVIGLVLLLELGFIGTMSTTAANVSASTTEEDEFKPIVEANILQKAIEQAEALDLYFSRIGSLVTILGENAQNLLENGVSSNRPSYFHNYSIETPDYFEYSSKHSQNISLAYSAYKVAPDSYDDPGAYLASPDATTFGQWNSSISDVIDVTASLDYMLISIYASLDDILWAYMGFEEGVHRSYPYHGPFSKEYDPRARPWYTQGANDDYDALSYTTPYLDATTGFVVDTCVYRVKNGMDELLGVVGLDFMLSTLQEEALATADTQTRPFLLNYDYEVLAHPDQKSPSLPWSSSDFGLTIGDVESSNAEMLSLLSSAKNGINSISEIDYGSGDNRYVVAIPLNNTDLIFGLSYEYIPVSQTQEDLLEYYSDHYTDIGIIQARQLESYLGRSESIISATAGFAKQIFTGNNITQMPSYYHNDDVAPAPPDMFFSTEYNRYISLESSCYKLAPDSFDADYQDTYNNYQEIDNPLDHLNESIISTINESAKLDLIWPDLHSTNPDHTWLYMGFEDGVHRSFPWHGPYGKTYDPRKRSWYVSAITGAKDVVLIMDESGSMGGTPMVDTKDAMGQVLDTLGPRDRFTVLTFDSYVESFNNDLLIASPLNIDSAHSYVNSRSAGGSTNINDALLDGLEILKDAEDIGNTPIIIFMTDGDPTVGVIDTPTIVSNVETANTLDARLFIFGLGGNVEYALLDELGSPENSETVYVPNSAQLPDAMANFYRFFISQADEHISWSWPYVDASGKGMIITASQAVILNDEVIGVIGVDLTLDTLFEVTQQLNPTPLGYNYVFDAGGVAVLHPSFADLEPGDWQEDAIRQPIVSLENMGSSLSDLVSECVLGETVSAITETATGEFITIMTPIGDSSLRFAAVVPFPDLPNVVSRFKPADNNPDPPTNTGLRVIIAIVILATFGGIGYVVLKKRF